MKRILLLILANYLVALSSSSADCPKAVNNILVFDKAQPSLVLSVYEKLSGHEFVIDSHVNNLSSPVTLKVIGPPQPKEEVLKELRDALLNQAGIVITQIDDKRESVTFNDGLRVEK